MRFHYAGALEIRRKGSVTHISAGYAACCSGDRAIKIRAQGNHTWLREKVTCKRCQWQLAHSASSEAK